MQETLASIAGMVRQKQVAGHEIEADEEDEADAGDVVARQLRAATAEVVCCSFMMTSRSVTIGTTWCMRVTFCDVSIPDHAYIGFFFSHSNATGMTMEWVIGCHRSNVFLKLT